MGNNRQAIRRPLAACTQGVLVVTAWLLISLPCLIRAGWEDKEHLMPDREPPDELMAYFQPPAELQDEMGEYRSPLVRQDGSIVSSVEQWRQHRERLRTAWHESMGPWPELIEDPTVRTVSETARAGGIRQLQLKMEVALGGDMVDAFLLRPPGDGPFPAVLVVYYDAQTGAGLGTPLRDFGWQLAQRGFVTLSLGKPNSGVNLQDRQRIPGRGDPYFGPIGQPLRVQPLSALAYAASNARHYLARRDEVDADRIGIVGHSFGGKWALLAACLDDHFACAAWSDPGIVFDERDRRKQNPGGSVNYWDPWYLGAEMGKPIKATTRYRFRKLPSEGQPRAGAYRQLMEGGHDLIELHALMAPRPFLVSGGTADLPERWTALNHAIAVNRLLGYSYRVAMTNRQPHAPTNESNEQIYRFFEWALKGP
jgi:dienelactone hydrolase